MTNYYVTKNPNGTWNYRKANAQRATGIVQTQKEAERRAKKIVGNQGGGEVRIQGRDYKFRDSDTVVPGNDPSSVIDTKY